MTGPEKAGGRSSSIDGRLRATYGLTCRAGESPAAKARAIAFEQTVELPPECVPEDLVRSVVGAVEGLEAQGAETWRATISYSADLVGGNFSQLMNLLYGNLSLIPGVRLLEVSWPAAVLDRFPGPRLGMAGLRALCGVGDRRPLTCAVAKPLGLSSRQLADQVAQMARAGIDIIKDDHSLVDQPSAPFHERVEVCQRAVEEANKSVGGSAVYFPSLKGGRELLDDIAFLQQTGCRGVVVLPFYLGLDTVVWLASDSGLGLLAHPSGSGVLFGAEHGVAPEVYLGQVLRIAGCDAVIYPHAGGRFPMSESTARGIGTNLLTDLGGLLPCAPAPGGSIEISALGEWLELYGPDSLFVVGSSVYCAADPAAAAGELVSTVHDAFT